MFILQSLRGKYNYTYKKNTETHNTVIAFDKLPLRKKKLKLSRHH